MIILMKKSATEAEIQAVIDKIRKAGNEPHVDKGISTLIGVRGDTTRLEENEFMLEGVDQVKRVSSKYKEVSREFHQQNSKIKVGDVTVGGGKPVIMAGPCAVETREQLLESARGVKAAGAQILRGGAFKPRTSPYAFQGLGEEGLKFLAETRKEVKIPIVTEIMNIGQMDLFAKYDIDCYQVGARNMQNFDMLKELGKIKKAVLLKRGPSATIEEFLLSAEYIMSFGNPRVILCERGIRTFETAYRNVLDLTAVALVKNLSHLPIIADPSHATGVKKLIPPMSRASLAAGADGLLIEAHINPKTALCDASQQLTIKEFQDLMGQLKDLM
ncbi:MAG: 3-deoxy-7-phosphoheptulonate synthase [Proteobacteria bacterium]|nr:3-deoxy-7-phosphoheptulonate synthase [Pseudomonadota bacterium]